jgi:recA bacterial DNA recombination protein
MAASPAIVVDTSRPILAPVRRPLSDRQVAEFPHVFRGRELTRKDRRLSSGIAALDAVINGGIVRGRVSEIVGRSGFGRTSLVASFAAAATRQGEVAAWIDLADAFDPNSLAAAGADLSRILWVGAYGQRGMPPCLSSGRRTARSEAVSNAFKAAEMVLGAGGFGLVVIDLSYEIKDRSPTECRALRLARAAERGGAAVIVMAARRTCGTFAALSLVLRGARPAFSRMAPGAPALFDGIRIEACVARNKLGASGQTASWRAMVDPSSAPVFRAGARTGRNERSSANAA